MGEQIGDMQSSAVGQEPVRGQGFWGAFRAAARNLVQTLVDIPEMTEDERKDAESATRTSWIREGLPYSD